MIAVLDFEDIDTGGTKADDDEGDIPGMSLHLSITHVYTQVYTHVYTRVYTHVCTHVHTRFSDDGDIPACPQRLHFTCKSLMLTHLLDGVPS